MNKIKALVAAAVIVPVVAFGQTVTLESGTIGEMQAGDMIGDIAGVAGEGGACISIADDETTYLGIPEGDSVDAASAIAMAAASGADSCSAAMATVTGNPGLVYGGMNAATVVGGMLGLVAVAAAVDSTDGGSAASITPTGGGEDGDDDGQEQDRREDRRGGGSGSSTTGPTGSPAN